MVDKVRALRDFTASEPGELGFQTGDIITVLGNNAYNNWWRGKLRDQVGVFPPDYVEAVFLTTREREGQLQGIPSGILLGMPLSSRNISIRSVRALYDFTPTEPGELGFNRDDIISVTRVMQGEWWAGKLRGEIGIFPLNYVEYLHDAYYSDVRPRNRKWKVALLFLCAVRILSRSSARPLDPSEFEPLQRPEGARPRGAQREEARRQYQQRFEMLQETSSRQTGSQSTPLISWAPGELSEKGAYKCSKCGRQHDDQVLHQLHQEYCDV